MKLRVGRGQKKVETCLEALPLHASACLRTAYNSVSRLPFFMDNREKLLIAASRVYAEVGFRGATTRRIAEEAGVNEVTLFRLFGSKAQLLAEAITCHDPMGTVSLPVEPTDPMRELSEWCEGHLVAIREMRGMIRKTMADLEEHPEMGPHLCNGQTPHFNRLTSYATRLVERAAASGGASPGEGPARGGEGPDSQDVLTACSMLFSAVFADAMSREVVPNIYPQPDREAAQRYVRVFLRALGVPVVQSASVAATTAASAVAGAPALPPHCSSHDHLAPAPRQHANGSEAA